MQRAVAAAFLSGGTSTITNPSWCDDARTAVEIIKRLGAEVADGGDELLIHGGFLPHSCRINCHESGLSMRMFTPIAALHRKEFLFEGQGSLLNRPVQMVGDALQQLGITFSSANGLLPFSIKGPIKSGSMKIDGSVSSQLLTGLLMALPTLTGDSEIIVKNLKSRPYIDMTIGLLKDFGITVINSDYQHFYISGGQKYKACTYAVEGDWSSAAFHMVAAAIAGEIIVNGLKIESFQADKSILRALRESGAIVQEMGDKISIKRADLHAFEFDATDCPDLFPPLAVLAANATGKSKIKGLSRLTHKESNRGLTIQQEMDRMGILIHLHEDEMLIEGGRIRGAFVHSHNDHRIAMMAAIAGLNSESPVTIAGADCVTKSYPQFFDHLNLLGIITEKHKNGTGTI